MTSWLPILHERLHDEGALIRVVVATVRGSAPREPGACMVIGTQGIDGTIGGGHLEFKATEIAHQMLAQPSVPARLDRFALGATLGQCCGGAVTLWFERFDASDLDFVAAALRDTDSGEPAVLVTMAGGDNGNHHARRKVWTHAPSGDDTAGAHILQGVKALLKAPATAPRTAVQNIDNQEILFERIDPQRYSLWLYGAGHVGKALVTVLADLPFQVTWIDSRDDAFPVSMPTHVCVRRVDDPATTVAQAPAGAYFLVMTHSHDIDYEVCRAILRRNDFAWAGLIGSETKAACFNVRFGRDDIPAERVARLVSPIGIDGIDSKLPGAIAIAAAAQLLQVAEAAAHMPSNLAAPRLAELLAS